MENPQKNEETARVFARYLKKEYGLEYKIVLPEIKNQPLFDAKLVSLENEELMLQMKQIICGDKEFMNKKRGEPGMGNPGKDWKMFNNVSVNSVIKKSEDQYKEKAKDLILILHIDEGYLIPSDADSIENFKGSNFKGIYMVSPKHELWKNGEEKIQDEFVHEIKKITPHPNGFRLIGGLKT
jgi:hypothetical protein